MTIRKVAGILALGLFMLTSCDKEGSCDGTAAKNFDLQGFSRITAGSAMRLKVHQGDQFSIRAEGCFREIKDLRMRIGNGQTLEIDFDKSRNQREPVDIEITMPALAAANLSGASEATIDGFSAAASNLRVVLSGAAKAVLNGTAIKTQVDLSGASKFTATGNTDLLYGNISGGSELHAFSVMAKEVDINTSGGSKAYIHVENSLFAEASGGSKIRYRGNPSIKELQTSGGGEITRD